MNEFHYPEDEEEFRVFETVQALRQKLKEQFIRINIKHQYFFITYSKGMYIYLSCSKCNCKLKYKKEANVFRLITFNNLHQHKYLDNDEIIQFIKDLPSTITINSSKALVLGKYKISRSKFYYLYHKANKINLTFSNFRKQLDQEKYQTRFLPYPNEDNRFPDIFLTVSPSMKENFQEFGQVLAYDVTYNVVRPEANRKKWGLGIFWGKNSNNHIIIFGISIINSETSTDFYGLFTSFFQIMGTEPDTILTDQQYSMISALKELKNDNVWNGIHMLDTFHILRNLKRKLKNQQIYKELKEAIYSDSEFQFKKYIKNAQALVSSQEDGRAISQFLNKRQKLCFCLAENKFIGFSNSTSFCQKGNDIVKQFITYEENAISVVKKVIKVSKMLQEKSLKYKISNFPFESLLLDPNLKMLRFMISQDVLKIIIRNYVKSMRLHPHERQNQWIFKNQDNTIVEAAVCIENRKLNCNCGYIQKTKTPCHHLFYLMRYFREDYMNYIDKRWHIKHIQKKERPKNAIGRPRLSRRNAH